MLLLIIVRFVAIAVGCVVVVVAVVVEIVVVVGEWYWLLGIEHFCFVSCV